MDHLILGVLSSVHLIVSILLNFCCCLRLLTLALPFPLELSRTAGDEVDGGGATGNCINCGKSRWQSLRLLSAFNMQLSTHPQEATHLPLAVLRHFEIFVASNAVVNLIKCHA